MHVASVPQNPVVKQGVMRLVVVLIFVTSEEVDPDAMLSASAQALAAWAEN